MSKLHPQFPSICLLFGLSVAASPSFAAGEVQLVDASSRVTSYRGPAIQTITADILVQNLDPTKKVGIRYKNHKGVWVDAWGAYAYTVGDGRELWKVSTSPCYSYYEPDCTMVDTDLAAQIQVGTQTYWDSNNGNNYHLNQNSGYRLANDYKVFTVSPGVVQRSLGPTGGLYLVGNILLENLNASKTVKIVYTTDGWATRANINANFIDTSGSFPPERFTNPGEFGGEMWGFSFNPPDGQTLEYFVQYDVNGQTYFDTNFGKNYKLAIPEYPSLSARGTHNAWGTYAPMFVRSGIDGSYSYEANVDVSGHDPLERFKFDVYGDWTVNYGDNDNNGYNRSGIADRSGMDIKYMDGPGNYLLQFINRTHEYRVQKQPNTSTTKRTLIFIYGKTVTGQDMFIRGGIDHNYAQNVLKTTCSRVAEYTNRCAIPMRQRLRLTRNDWATDSFLDWYGKEMNQTDWAVGSPLIWTTNNKSNSKTIVKDEVGYTPLNKYGDHYWMLDVDMDCTKTVNGWFELKSFISNGPGWEKDIVQPGAPYSSKNHFGQCGKINVFRRGENAAQIADF